MKNICLGFIGAGYISNAHALALRSASEIMGVDADVSFGAICSDIPEEAERFAQRFNCKRVYSDWQDLVADANVNTIIIGTPPCLHFAQAKAAILAGKHIICEKPIAMHTHECVHLYELANKHGVRDMVGLTYLAHPAMVTAREMVKKLGKIYAFSAHFNEDHLCDANVPFHWHCDKEIAGHGTTADLGYHVAGHLLYLLGMPTSLAANREIKIPKRIVSHASRTRSINAVEGQSSAAENEKGAKPTKREVTSDDMANAIIRYDEELAGVIQVSRVATGRDQFVHIEINGSQGSLFIDMEDMNALQLYLRQEDKLQDGFKRIFIGPQHKYYSQFCPAPGHGLGFNDLLIIQDGCFLDAVVNDRDTVIADLNFGSKVHRIIEAIAEASDTQSWVYIKHQ